MIAIAALPACAREEHDEEFNVEYRISAPEEVDRVVVVLTPGFTGGRAFRDKSIDPSRTFEFKETDLLSTLYDRLVVVGFRGETLVGAAIGVLEYAHPERGVWVARGMLALDPSATAEIFGMPEADCLRVTIGSTTYEATRVNDDDCDGVDD